MIVHDNATGLDWQKAYFSEYYVTWQDALNYCETSTYRGRTDWRLPNINELNSILDEQSPFPYGDDFDEWWTKYGPPGDIDGYASWIFLNNSIQGIGVLVRKNLVDVGIVYDLMGTMVARHWEKAEPLVRGMRERFQVKMYNDVEYLYNELRKYGENQPELQT